MSVYHDTELIKKHSIGSFTTLDRASIQRKDEYWWSLALWTASAWYDEHGSSFLEIARDASHKHIAKAFALLLKAPLLCCYSTKGCDE